MIKKYLNFVRHYNLRVIRNRFNCNLKYLSFFVLFEKLDSVIKGSFESSRISSFRIWSFRIRWFNFWPLRIHFFRLFKLFVLMWRFHVPSDRIQFVQNWIFKNRVLVFLFLGCLCNRLKRCHIRISAFAFAVRAFHRILLSKKKKKITFSVQSYCWSRMTRKILLYSLFGRDYVQLTKLRAGTKNVYLQLLPCA